MPASEASTGSAANMSNQHAGFLSVPTYNMRRRHYLDSEDASRPVSSHGATSVAGSNNKFIMDENALKPDAGTRTDFQVENNPFAFSPGQLNKMLNPKSLSAFFALGGLAGIEKGLRTDRKAGLSVDEAGLDVQVTLEEATGKENRPAASPKTGAGVGEIFQDRIRVFKDNRLPEKKGKSLLHLIWTNYNDRVLILLSIAAVVSLALGLYETFRGEHGPGQLSVDWVEGVAIIAAIAIVVIVGSLNDYQKERQFAKLTRKKQDYAVKAVRSGKMVEISVYDILVGDVIYLEPGDHIPVDGILIEGFNVKCDESQATGESDIIQKRSADDVYSAIENHESLEKMDPFIISGARVMEGLGTMMTTSTGIYSSHGKVLMALREDPDLTPLQAKLNVISTYIAKIGGLAGLLLSIVLLIGSQVNRPQLDSNITPAEEGQMFLQIFNIVVAIIAAITVAAMPEGLTLAATLASAFATTRIRRDNDLGRRLKALVALSNASNICSDKTGTLTQNNMRVVSGTIGTSHIFDKTQSGSRDSSDDQGMPLPNGGDIFASKLSMLSASIKDLLVKSIALNSTAFEDDSNGGMTFIGSKTETALLSLARDHLGMGLLSEERQSAEVLQMIPFDSRRKCMGIVIQTPEGGARLYIKGASETVLDRCDRTIRDPGVDDSIASLTPENTASITRLIESYAMRSLRTIGISYRDFESWPPPDARRGDGDGNEVAFEDLFEHMTFLGMVGIQDPLRDGIAEAAKECQKAGVMVRMVTGDNQITARAIAKECGIYLPSDGIVMEGPDFRNLGKLKQNDIAKLQSLSRSSPEDKRALVKRLREMGTIIAVTGDGTNDAPALKMADIGFSMGIAGTEVAKEASSIILMDDNFTSVIKALEWARAVNYTGKRFLQLQLTVNVTAMLLTFITAVSNGSQSSVLIAVQPPWVNLMMVTLAALALGILNRRPELKGSSIVSTMMWEMILGQPVHQLAITLLPLHYGSLRGVLSLLGGVPPYQIAFDSQAPTMWDLAIFLGFLSIPVGVAIRLILDRVLVALAPDFPKHRASKVPESTISNEEMEMYPDLFAQVRDELKFLRRLKGGRLSTLRYGMQHPKEMLQSRHTRDRRGVAVRAAASLPSLRHPGIGMASCLGSPWLSGLSHSWAMIYGLGWNAGMCRSRVEASYVK